MERHMQIFFCISVYLHGAQDLFQRFEAAVLPAASLLPAHHQLCYAGISGGERLYGKCGCVPGKFSDDAGLTGGWALYVQRFCRDLHRHGGTAGTDRNALDCPFHRATGTPVRTIAMLRTRKV